MKLVLAALATATLSILSTYLPAAAATFGQQEVNQDNFIILAMPRGSNAHSLLIVEQISKRRACWQENQDQYQTVKPLLLNFDFTGICGRSTDSNAFSIRVAGQDLGLKYSLRLAYRDNVTVLLATPAKRGMPELEIGRTKGITRDFMKIILDPGWRLTKRTYNSKVMGHVYLTNNTDLATIATQTAPSATSTTPPVATPPPTTTAPVATPPRTVTPPAATIAPAPTAPRITTAPPITTQPPIITSAAVKTPTPAATLAPVIPPGNPITKPLQTNTLAADINRIYQEVLGRDAEPAGLAYHLQRAEAGRPLALVRQDIEGSQEARRVAVNRIYQDVFGRNAEPTELAYQLKRLEQGSTLPEVRQDVQTSYQALAVLSNNQPQPTETAPPPAMKGSATAPPAVALSTLPSKEAYYAVIPTSLRELPSVAERIQRLGMADKGILQRQAPRGPHVAVGPFTDRQAAEQWSNYLRGLGLDARVYFGQ